MEKFADYSRMAVINNKFLEEFGIPKRFKSNTEQLEIYLHEREKSPSFYIGKNNGKKILCRISLLEPIYLKFKRKLGKRSLRDYEIEIIDAYFSYTFSSISNWESICSLWENWNFKEINTKKKPEYFKLRGKYGKNI